MSNLLSHRLFLKNSFYFPYKMNALVKFKQDLVDEELVKNIKEFFEDVMSKDEETKNEMLEKLIKDFLINKKAAQTLFVALGVKNLEKEEITKRCEGLEEIKKAYEKKGVVDKDFIKQMENKYMNNQDIVSIDSYRMEDIENSVFRALNITLKKDYTSQLKKGDKIDILVKKRTNN